MRSTTATLIGFTAVLMWALLALMSAASGAVPPFQLAAMTFLIGGLMGAVTRSEEHTSELQSHVSISYAVFCLKKIFFNDTATTEIYTLSLHDALPIWRCSTF